MIYDCFMFFDELMLLEIRLKELSPVVDKFVLVEATHNHAGVLKHLYYEEVKDNETFAPFKDKIIHLVYDEPMLPDRFANDRNQRNYIAKGLTDAEADDIIIVTDLDEIVDHRVIPFLMKETVNTTGHFRMKLFYYYFDCRASQDWYYGAYCRFKNYATADSLRLMTHYVVVMNAGWHFAYLFPPDRIAKKLEAFAHAEYDTDYYKDVDRLQEKIHNNEDIFERGMKFLIEPLDAPKCVMNNRDKYSDYIKGHENIVSYA